VKTKPSNETFKKQPISEDLELSDDEPKIVDLSKEQTVTHKFITFDCPLCMRTCTCYKTCVAVHGFQIRFDHFRLLLDCVWSSYA